MKTQWKRVALALAAAVVAVPAGLAATIRLRPVKTSPVWTERIESTPERLARGRYLADHVAVCADCHSERDWTSFAGPIIRGTRGAGGTRFGHDIGFPGEVVSRNITSHPVDGVGAWSDGELVRAIREGVDRGGRPLAPIMPYEHFRSMGDDDVRAVVLGALAAARGALKSRAADGLPLSLLVRTIPAPAGARGDGRVTTPAPRVDAAYGRYLVTLASCADCHTPSVRGEAIAGREFAGGQEFQLPGYVLRSANITPDPTGIGAMSEDAFVARFHSYRTPPEQAEVPRPARNSACHGHERGRPARHLRYLRTLRPVHNVVPRG
ncbi:MAG: cytochrome C [Deltaproteobacteria bacterium]|nr:cytochrome C [Deltaproteobacteria bacterium]